MAGQRFKKMGGEIPIEIVEDILIRLPLMQLTKFRCVCKRWGQLIVDEEFTARRKTRVLRRFLSLHEGEGLTSSFVYIHDSNRNGKPKMIVEEADLFGKNNSLVVAYVVGHVNGLFCFQLRDGDIVVWNPCLKQLRRIISPGPYFGFRMIGFGYDHSIEDYKIIVASPISYQNHTLAEIYSLKSDSRIVDIHPCCYCETRRGTLLDRYLYWFSCSPRGKFILQFDLVSETSKQLPCPPHDDNVASQDLVVIKGRMCVLDRHAFRAENKIVIWGCDEGPNISDEESWKVWFTVPMENIGIPGPWIICYYPNHCAEDTELLMTMTFELVQDKVLFTCNLKEGKFVKVETDMTLSRSMFELYEYVETLVSPWLVDLKL